jgi:hypothetical protein
MLIGRGPLVVAVVQAGILLVAMLLSSSRRRASEPDVQIDLTTPSVAGIPQQRNVRVIDLTDTTIEELLNSDR